MNNLVFLYEKNGFFVSKLTIYGFSYFIVQNNTTGRRFIRKSQSVVDKITVV